LCLLLAWGANPTTADTPYEVSIIDRASWVYHQTVERYPGVLPGETIVMCLWIDPESGPHTQAGGFDFLVCYDSAAVAPVAVWPGPDLHPDWEYFDYRIGQVSDTCGVCPGGFLRIVGLADIVNGSTPPAEAYDLSGCLAELTFQGTTDTAYKLRCYEMGLCALDCGDNTIATRDGDSLFLPATGVMSGPDYVLDSCVSDSPGVALPLINYTPGYICLIEPPRYCGDVNLNGIEHEIGDAVLYSNFLIYGTRVLDPAQVDAQLQGMEMNCDSLVATTADLSYLINIITGYVQPSPPECCPFNDTIPAMYYADLLPGPSPSGQDSMRVGNAAAAPGDTFAVDILVHNTDTLGAFNFRLRYDPALIQPLLDTLTNLGDTAIVLEPAEQLRGAVFEVFTGGFPATGVFTFLASDFDLGYSGPDLFLPGSGAAIRMQWMVLTSAAPQVTSLLIEGDTALPHTFNTMVDLHAENWKHPVLLSGTVEIGGGVCSCPYQGDFDGDGFVNAIDLAGMIDVLFSGSISPHDPDCPFDRTDLNCSGFGDALDLAFMIDLLFAGGPPPCDPCGE
jgi:hypothetical protein